MESLQRNSTRQDCLPELIPTYLVDEFAEALLVIPVLDLEPQYLLDLGNNPIPLDKLPEHPSLEAGALLAGPDASTDRVTDA